MSQSLSDVQYAKIEHFSEQHPHRGVPVSNNDLALL